jgi:hypothetical protein
MSCLCWYVIDESQPILCPECRSKERDHTATIDPQIIIQRLVNGENVLPELRGMK